MTKEEAIQLQNSIKQLGSANVANLLISKSISIPTKSKSDKPRLSRHLKRMTYYRERFALQMKEIIDGMIAEYEQDIFKERFFPYKSYEETLTKNSLFLKINQSWLYVRNEMDDNGKYSKFNENITIVKRDDGIRIKYQPSTLDTSELKPEIVSNEKEQRKEYQSQLDEFLENAKVNGELNINGLVLNESEIEQIDASLCQLDNFIYKLSSSKIWIVKISD